ncbi:MULTISPECIES: AI-2E family transporter [Vitreoscilla]|uniref:AI-2E family transporter n=1 Tax=Vitreoscilla stercoraria TaxID=61 RepID=A0ABY4E7W6_VITST|nr:MULTISPECIES: AI-2E family transporter [Vitreoscilla]AUZ04433.1 hypothetical protein ADP71_06670 [Vitreoscilla sp. C1]UOO91846.1 AI-2E family transporter [Vitreoscilla stercoraria]
MYVRKRSTYLNWVVGFVIVLILGFLVHQLSTILTPFIAAAILAYILNPVVNQLTRRKLSRNFSAILVTLFAIFIVVSLILFIIPMMLKQFEAAWQKLPDMVRYIETALLPWVNQTFHVQWGLDSKFVIKYVTENGEQIRTGVTKIMPFLANQGGHLVVMLVNLFLLPILLYYFLVDWPRWSAGLVKMIPRRYLERFSRIGHEIDETLSEYLRGQLLVMILVGLIYGGGLALIGLDSGFAIGMIAGMLVIIPYLGAFIGLLLATMAALLQFGNLSGLLSVWAVFLVGQSLESYVITPRFVGERIGLSPLLVIFALMAFGQLMGFVGMLLALPLAAICLVLFRELMQNYYKSHYYRR